ncbi:OmpA family protein [Iodobacter sp. LRB]|uniref:OmpA family protein n=1 Tax=Iodobacter violaceini TaxID=3044271 RepID=A0ABX0KRB7_9NEIS|nr:MULTISPECIES: OmpA family protein [Iodobacter]NHQ86462.1 OmpA family protein [Iodobacter violacea]PHV02050.1 flagellar motor protein MotB [Iodobacter sp. BJB302]
MRLNQLKGFTGSVLLFVAVLLQGCASNSYIVLLENPNGHTGAVQVKGEQGEQLINIAGYGAALDGSETPAAVDAEKIQEDFGDAMAARPKIPKHFLLYFQVDTMLTEESEMLLPEIIAEAKKWPAVDISVVGHTDTLGSAAINEELALVRANLVAEWLKQKGLEYHALTVESHGERNLLVMTPDETLEPRNRRVEISIR